MSMRFEIPTLETERLILRAPAERDFGPWLDFNASPRTRFVGGHVPRNTVWRGLAAYLGHWALRGYGMWAVDERATGLFCGNIGPWFPEGWPEPEIGWTVMEAAEGRGIAREAAQAARTWAYETLGWTTAISLIDPENTRSIALATRLGAQHERDFEHDEYGVMRIYRHPSPEEAVPGQTAPEDLGK
ncbi:MAG: GNAT family N-acetyltransferase [Pseudomonadota bacterium]